MNKEEERKGLVLVLNEVCRCLEVLLHHLLHEVVERDDALPAELGLGLCGVSEEKA